jgi:hypothetical protein
MSTIRCILDHIAFSIDKAYVVIWLPHLNLLSFEIAIHHDAWPVKPSVIVFGDELHENRSE